MGSITMTEERYSMKDDFFNESTTASMASAIKAVYDGFDDASFVAEVVSDYEGLELKQRMTRLMEGLVTYLPGEFERDIHIMKQSLIALEQGHFIYGAYCEYVAEKGCSEERLASSLEALGFFTQWFSAEFAIRSFINAFPEASFEAMMTWAGSDNHHQRRLASEGLRPKLPWAKAITMDYTQAMKPLDYLYSDSERYVTRSVANHMNDISKMNPGLVVETLQRWQDEGAQAPVEMAYIISHSTRTLVKKGYQPALSLLGYGENPSVEVQGFKVLTPSIKLGESLIFGFSLVAHEDVKLMIDYEVDYPMAGDKRSTKVFKIKKASLNAGETLKIEKKHVFKQMTTKKLYPGNYALTLQINGRRLDQGTFYLDL